MAGGDHDISYLGNFRQHDRRTSRVRAGSGGAGDTRRVETALRRWWPCTQAVTGLREGEVDLALVGGVNAVLSPRLTREMAELGMLSPEGQCKAFDGSANGLRVGETVAAWSS